MPDALNQLTYTVLADISGLMTPRHGDPDTANELWLEVRRKVVQAIVDAVEMGAREATEAQAVKDSHALACAIGERDEAHWAAARLVAECGMPDDFYDSSYATAFNDAERWREEGYVK